MSTFRYQPDLLTRYPSLVGGVILAHGMTNQPTTPDLLQSYQAEQEEVKRRIGDTPLSELPSLAAWRRAFSAFNVNPTQYRSAAEALLRRLTKKGRHPKHQYTRRYRQSDQYTSCTPGRGLRYACTYGRC